MIPNLERIARAKPYAPEAYELVLRGLNLLVEAMNQPRHVSGAELSHGIRRYALQEFGPMAKHVLNSWGIYRTRDLGEIVFLLIENDLLRKTDEDRIEDFDDCFDFHDAFDLDYYDQHATFKL